MHPRTVIIIVVLILFTSVGLRFLLPRLGWFMTDEETILKQATAIVVSFNEEGVPKRVVISNAAEVEAVLAKLRVRNHDRWDGPRPTFGPGVGPWGSMAVIEFWFPDDSRRQYELQSRTALGHLEIDPGFYQVLCDMLSRREGKRIELFGENQ
jgi:hypothetical protein